MLECDFSTVFNHLCEYSWIYDFNNTKLFSESVLNNIPLEWQYVLEGLSTEEMNDIPYGFTKKEWPKSLINYIKCTTKLSLRRHRRLEVTWNGNNIDIPSGLKKGMSPKKLMEVTYLSELVSKVCTESRCFTVLDIGCGLGYVDQVLHYNFGYKIIGVDSESNNCRGALKRIKSMCTQNIHYRTLKINENCSSELKELLNDIPSYSRCYCGHRSLNVEMEEERILMLSLHSCGDLTPNMLRLYVEIPDILGIVNVGCCYHIMKKDETETRFLNFPLSKVAKQAYNDTIQKHPTWKASIYGLRLAAQGTREHWKRQNAEQHENHSKYVAYRAMLQVYLERNEIKWRKPQRHLRRTQMNSFGEYIKVAVNSIYSERSQRQKAEMELYSIYEEFIPTIKMVEVLTLLQLLLQPLWEMIIVYDRCLYLQESGIEATIVTAIDESVSPRNLAVVAIKS